MRNVVLVAGLAALVACGGRTGDPDDDDVADDAGTTDGSVVDAMADDAAAADGSGSDGGEIDGAMNDASVIDASVIDARVIDAQLIDAQLIDAQVIDAPSGPITGGPCLSGAPGATAYRIRWAGNGSGSSAYPVYEVHAMPDESRFRAAAYGYTIPFTPQFVDTALAQGGLLLNSSSFVDIELSTVGIASITSAHVSIYGRSYNTTASGSFNWQTFDGTGATPSNVVSNSTPYTWDSGDMTTEISAGDDGVRIRIKAGPSSGSLAVNRIEICLQAT